MALPPPSRIPTNTETVNFKNREFHSIRVETLIFPFRRGQESRRLPRSDSRGRKQRSIFARPPFRHGPITHHPRIRESRNIPGCSASQPHPPKSPLPIKEKDFRAPLRELQFCEVVAVRLFGRPFGCVLDSNATDGVRQRISSKFPKFFVGLPPPSKVVRVLGAGLLGLGWGCEPRWLVD